MVTSASSILAKKIQWLEETVKRVYRFRRVYELLDAVEAKDPNKDKLTEERDAIYKEIEEAEKQGRELFPPEFILSIYGKIAKAVRDKQTQEEFIQKLVETENLK